MIIFLSKHFRQKISVVKFPVKNFRQKISVEKISVEKISVEKISVEKISVKKISIKKLQKNSVETFPAKDVETDFVSPCEDRKHWALAGCILL